MIKGKIKPTSIRIPEKLLEKIDTICNDSDCSRNDYITSILDEAIHNEIDDNEDQNTKQDNEQSKEEPKEKPKVVINLDDTPKTESIPKATVKIIDEEPKKIDNSNNPPVQMAWFNGKCLPFAKRYNI